MQSVAGGIAYARVIQQRRSSTRCRRYAVKIRESENCVQSRRIPLSLRDRNVSRPTAKTMKIIMEPPCVDGVGMFCSEVGAPRGLRQGACRVAVDRRLRVRDGSPESIWRGSRQLPTETVVHRRCRHGVGRSLPAHLSTPNCSWRHCAPTWTSTRSRRTSKCRRTCTR